MLNFRPHEICCLFILYLLFWYADVIVDDFRKSMCHEKTLSSMIKVYEAIILCVGKACERCRLSE